MTPYLAVLTFVGLAALLSLVSPPRYRWVIAGPPALVVLCFMGFRDRISADWNQYVSIFREYTYHSFAQARSYWGIEVGYGVLNLIVGRLTGNFHALLFICAAILLWGILRLARDFDLDPALTLFLAVPYLIFAVGMGYERQSSAMGFAFVALCELKAGKTRKFFVYAALATLLHYSAGPFLLVFWVNSWLRAVIVAAVAGGSIFLSAVNETADKFNGYVTGSLAASGVWFRLGILAIALVAVYLQRKAWRADPIAFRYLKRSAAILFVLAAFAQFQSVIVDRFSLYFFFIYLVGLGKVIQFSAPSRRWLTFSFVTVQAFGIMILWFQISFFARYFWIPYTIAFY